MTILMFNMSNYTEWQSGIVNRNYHILHTLEKLDKIDKIIIVDFLPFTKKRAIRNYYECIIKGPKGGEIIFGDLTSKFRQISSKIYNYSTVDSIFSKKTVIKEIKKILERTNINPKELIIWSYNPMFADLINDLDYKNFIFDTVDNWMYHESFKNQVKHLENNYELITNKADIIFTVSKDLVDFYNQKGRQNKVYWIPNGVAFDLYQDPEIINKKNELDDIKKPIIGYLGTIQKRFDIQLIKFLAVNNPDYNFVFVGPVWKETQKQIDQELQGLDNLHFFGRKSYLQSPSYINKFDVAIIPHKLDDFLKTTDPMKMYEYLALGKPIVTTPGAGTDVFKDYLYVASNNEEFSKKIKIALLESNQELINKRKQVIMQHTWESRVNKMLEYINL